MADVGKLRAAVKGDDGFFDALILDRGAGVLAQMPGPRADEEGLAKVFRVVEVVEQRAAEGAIAQSRSRVSRSARMAWRKARASAGSTQ